MNEYQPMEMPLIGSFGNFARTFLVTSRPRTRPSMTIAISMNVVASVAYRCTASDGVSLLARFTWEIGGAVAFGVLVGAMFALYLRYVGREVALVVIAVCALLSQVGTTQQFEPLLAAVAAGLVIENLSLAQGDALKTAVQGTALPVLVIFFVAVGTSLRLDGRKVLRVPAHNTTQVLPPPVDQRRKVDRVAGGAAVVVAARVDRCPVVTDPPVTVAGQRDEHRRTEPARELAANRGLRNLLAGQVW